ncbi:hypothetical protein IL306_000378 [Fusarium sp. DS 682]|nr:hypothetical protein IL306_000378 [Fusarium sp. DS 682]
MNSTADPKCHQALSLIEDEELPHPLGKLLKSFIVEALYPALAAAHVLNACEANNDRKTVLLELVADWTYIVESGSKHSKPPPSVDERDKARIVKRDGNRCCITGKAGSFRDPLIVTHVMPMPIRWLDAKPRIQDMLSAFFGPPYFNWWMKHIKLVDERYAFCSEWLIDNYWLVRRSAAEAFRNGLVKLDRDLPSFVEVGEALFFQQTKLTLTKIWVTPCLIGSSEPVIDVDGDYALLGDHSRTGIRRIDARFIGTHSRLAPSMRWLELKKKLARDQSPPRLPGEPLAQEMDELSDRDCREFIEQMQDFMVQLRSIPHVGPEGFICNTFGEACSDPRIRSADYIGPFEDEAAFNQYLYHPDDPARRGHRVVFTHADLNLRNILVDRVTRLDGTRGWAVSGIVDWENSGFYPEYWDCTKTQFEGFRWDERWRRALVDVFKPFGGYSKELELERKSWREGDGAF